MDRLNFYVNDASIWGEKTKGVPLSILTYEIFNITFKNYDKLFYMDADLQFVGKSDYLFDDNFDILVFPDIGLNYRQFKNIRDICFEVSNYHTTKIFFNAGFIIINPKNINFKDIILNLFSYHMKNIRRVKTLYEQSLLNLYFKQLKHLKINFGKIYDCLLIRVLENNNQFNKELINMIHYVGVKPIFKKTSLSTFFWYNYSILSLNLLKKNSNNKKIHIFCRNFKENIYIKENDILIFMNKYVDYPNKYKNNLKIYFNGLTKDCEELLKKLKFIDVFCIPGFSYTNNKRREIVSNLFGEKPYLYIDYFKIISEKYRLLKENYLRINKKRNLPTTGVSAILFSLLLTEKENIFVYDMNLFNNGEKGKDNNGSFKYQLPHSYDFDSMVLKTVGYDYMNKSWN